jgi:hypothetical protein
MRGCEGCEGLREGLCERFPFSNHGVLMVLRVGAIAPCACACAGARTHAPAREIVRKTLHTIHTLNTPLNVERKSLLMVGEGCEGCFPWN